jgi:hypothetical protein
MRMSQVGLLLLLLVVLVEASAAAALIEVAELLLGRPPGQQAVVEVHSKLVMQIIIRDRACD